MRSLSAGSESSGRPTSNGATDVTGRFLVFAFRTYYPRGGASDLIARADSAQEAERLALDALDDEIGDTIYDHAHYYDTALGETIAVVDPE